MNKNLKSTVVALFSATILTFNCQTAFAEVKLPDGAVTGFSDKISVLDSDGNTVDSDGEYFFSVEDMVSGETYSKDIQITNLREDKAYKIYFYVEPVSKSGEIDLESSCTAVFTLDNKKIFEGNVNGISIDGTQDLSDNPIELGSYEPGESHNLNCSVVWTAKDIEASYDNGDVIVEKGGVEVDREAAGESHIDGEITFKWIFYAVVDEDYVPPQTGIISTRDILIAMIAALALLITVLLVLIFFKKKSRKQRCK